MSYVNGTWKISQLSTPNVQALLSMGINLGSSAEKNITEKGVRIRTVYEEPESIRVQLNSTLEYAGQTNYQYWNKTKGSVQSIPLYTYVKDVLPNEWDCDKIVPDTNNNSTKLYNALEAGGIMVKTFACYHSLYPWNPSIGADVNDYYSQVYLHGTYNKTGKDSNGVNFAWGSMCSSAVDSEGYNTIMRVMGAYEPIFAHYNQSAQDETSRLDKLGKNEIEIAESIYTDFFGDYTSAEIEVF